MAHKIKQGIMKNHDSLDITGAEGRNRTGTGLPPRDFKSQSTNKPQLTAIANNSQFNLLLEMFGCLWLQIIAIICWQVAYFWPTDKE